MHNDIHVERILSVIEGKVGMKPTIDIHSLKSEFGVISFNLNNDKILLRIRYVRKTKPVIKVSIFSIIGNMVNYGIREDDLISLINHLLTNKQAYINNNIK